jgi:hypothetical protein
MSIREAKGQQIADRYRIVKNGNLYLVPSQSGKGKYTVDLERGRCNCPDFDFTQAKCKHIFAAEFTVRRERKTVTETKADGSTKTTVTETVKVTRKTGRHVWEGVSLVQRPRIFRGRCFCPKTSHPAQIVLKD